MSSTGTHRPVMLPISLLQLTEQTPRQPSQRDSGCACAGPVRVPVCVCCSCALQGLAQSPQQWGLQPCKAHCIMQPTICCMTPSTSSSSDCGASDETQAAGLLLRQLSHLRCLISFCPAY